MSSAGTEFPGIFPWAFKCSHSHLPVFWVWTKQRCQHHHLIFTGSDLSDRQDLMLGLRVTDIQHGRGAGLVLFEHTRSPISHLQWEVGSQLTFYILSGHLDTSGWRNRKETTDVRRVSKLGKRGLLLTFYCYLLLFRLMIWHFLPLRLYLKK